MKKLIAILVLPLLLLTACKREPAAIALIPKESLGVFRLSVRNLTKKVGTAALSDSRVFKDLMGRISDTSLPMTEMGIDFGSDLFAYGLADQRMPNQFKFFLLLPLKNKKKFEQYLANRFREETVSSGKRKTLALDKHAVFVWDDHTAIYAFFDPPQDLHTLDEQLLQILKQDVANAFSLPKEQSVGRLEAFQSFLKETNDFGFWFNYDAFRKSVPPEGFGPTGSILSAQKNLVEETYLYGGLNFLKGQISIRGKYIYNETSKALAAAFTKVDYSDRLLKRLPGRRLNLMAHVQLNMQAIPELLDSLAILPLTRMGLQQNGFEVEDLQNVFQGDLLYSIVDFDLQKFSTFLFEAGDPREPFFQSAFTTRIKDGAVYARVLHFLVERQLAVPTPDGLFTLGNYYFGNSGDYLVLSEHAATVHRLLDFNGEAQWKLPPRLNEFPLSFYAEAGDEVLDFAQLLPPGGLNAGLLRSVSSISAYGGKMEGDFSSFQIDIQFRNKERNSFVELLAAMPKAE